MGVAPLTTPADAVARGVSPRNATNAHQGGRDDVIIYDGGTNDVCRTDTYCRTELWIDFFCW
jgi:hypothetical protein